MTEWGVYLVVVSLFAAAAAIARPVAALTKTNTRLECAVDKLADAMEKFEARVQQLESGNQQSHRRMWEHMNKQEAKIDTNAQAVTRHETELNNLKGRKQAG